MKQTKCALKIFHHWEGSQWRHLWWVPSRRGCAQQASSSSSLLAKSSASSLLWLLRLVLRGWRLDINALSQSLQLRWQSKQLTKSWIWKDWVSCCWSTLATATTVAARWGHLLQYDRGCWGPATSYLSVIEPETMESQMKDTVFVIFANDDAAVFSFCLALWQKMAFLRQLKNGRTFIHCAKN